MTPSTTPDGDDIVTRLRALATWLAKNRWWYKHCIAKEAADYIEQSRRSSLVERAGDEGGRASPQVTLPAENTTVYRGVIHDGRSYLKAVVFWDQFAWVASALEVDVGTQGATPIQALWRLQVAATSDEQFIWRTGRDALPAAPPSMHERWSQSTATIGNLGGASLNDAALAEQTREVAMRGEAHPNPVPVERAEIVEEIVQRLNAHWKSCMERGDQRGEDMAYGINLAVESIRSLSREGGGTPNPTLQVEE